MNEASNRQYLSAALSTETLKFDSIHRRLGDPVIMRLLHATLGLGSEMIELELEMETGNEAGILAELGDIFWFGGIGADAISKHVPSVEPWEVFGNTWSAVEPTHMRSPEENMFLIGRAVEGLQTNVKAHIYYGRELDYISALESIKAIIGGAKDIGRYRGWGTIDIMKANLMKLTDKKHGRYKKGFIEGEANEDRDVANEDVGLEYMVAELKRDKEVGK